MPNEKTWYMTNTINQVCAGGSVDADVGASWMYNLYTFISGGAGQTTSPWTIMSASNASSVTTVWTGSGDVTWNRTGSAHSWFVARNNNILPTSGHSLYLTIACANTASAGDGIDYWMSFDHTEPNFTGSSTSQPPHTASATTAYCTQYLSASVEPTRFRYPYAGTSATTYFHGVMDETTGSFVVFTGQAHSSLYAYPYSLAAIRLETPRTAVVDPYPVLVKNCWNSTSPSAGIHGGWGMNSIAYVSNNTRWAIASNYDPGDTVQNYYVGQAMWWVDGSRQANSPVTVTNPTDSWTTRILSPGGNGQDALEYIDGLGDDLDGTYPALPLFVSTYRTSGPVFHSVRGRLPDIKAAPWGGATSLGGATTPAVGTPTACIVGDQWFPVTASLLPGS